MSEPNSKFARRYDREFKKNAVALVLNGRSQSEVSRDLGVSGAENWLAKVPAPERPGMVWQSDFTCIETGEGWLCLASSSMAARAAAWPTTAAPSWAPSWPPPPLPSPWRASRRRRACSTTATAACSKPPMPSRNSPPPGASPAA